MQARLEFMMLPVQLKTLSEGTLVAGTQMYLAAKTDKTLTQHAHTNTHMLARTHIHTHTHTFTNRYTYALDEYITKLLINTALGAYL